MHDKGGLATMTLPLSLSLILQAGIRDKIQETKGREEVKEKEGREEHPLVLFGKSSKRASYPVVG